MSDAKVIDMAAYLRARDSDEPVSPLALSGTDGERRRYALPLWRMSYVANARWAGVVRIATGAEPRAVVVVDLARDPARQEIPCDLEGLDTEVEPPAILLLPNGTLVLPLGEGPDEALWYVVAADRDEGEPEPALKGRRDDLLFLAGECAGVMALIEGKDVSPPDPSDA